MVRDVTTEHDADGRRRTDATAVDARASPASTSTTLPGGARGALEAVLMVVDEPVDDVALAAALACPPTGARELLAELAAEYDAAGRGFELREVAGGWRFYSRAGVRAGRRAVRARRPDRPGSPRPRWRRWPSSPTGSR